MASLVLYIDGQLKIDFIDWYMLALGVISNLLQNSKSFVKYHDIWINLKLSANQIM